MYKKCGILGLFMFLVIILMVNPRIIHNMYNNILGRVVLIVFVIFFTINNITLGLLAALCLIIALNMFFMEGLENMDDTEMKKLTTGVTIGDDNATNNVSSDKKIIVTTKAKRAGAPMDGSKISDLKAQAQEQGVDRQTVEETIRSKSSKSLPVNDASKTSDDVQPSEPASTEGFEGSIY